MRMGSDKALLPAGRETLLQQVARSVATAAGSVAVVGDPARYGHLVANCIPDLHPGFGPLSGLETALVSSKAEWNLVCACDMPGLDTAFLRRLLESSVACQHVCAAAADPDGSLHPLCAVYHQTCLPIIQSAMREGELALMKLLARLEVVPFPSPDPLPNCNTPEEWAAACI